MEKSPKPIPHHLSDFLDWLEIEKGLSSKSQENYARFLKRFFDWLEISSLENLKPHELTPEHIWKYRLFLSRQYLPKTKQPLKKSTQNYYLIALRSLLNYFADRDILSLPAEKIKLAKDKGERQVRFLNLEQLEKLFLTPDVSKIQGLRDRAILETLFSTGTRIAELTALNREQIKIKLGMEELELSIVGKGGRIRTVYFSQRALFWLKKYLETRKDKEKALFINYRSKIRAPRRLTPRSIEKIIKKCAILAGLPLTTTPHVMRHSFATDLLNQGVDLRTIQEFLGHKSIAATQIYAHVTSKQLRDIHRKFHSLKE
ncbi:MAG: tyrosine-type recombinase/integrase [Candidatus Nealsonbacteria bacterium]|nr:tyrosine-type recombinase/integrase [Candidatus Nealsonbacteria bacterium]